MNRRFTFVESYLNSVRQNRLNLFILFLVLPWLVPLVGYLMWEQRYFSSVGVFISGTLLNLSICLLTHQLNQWIAGVIANRYPDTHQSLLRVLLLFVLYSMVNVAVYYAVVMLYASLNLFGFVMAQQRDLWATIVLVGTSLLGAGLSELSYTFMQWKQNQQELNDLEQRQLQIELDAVKQQVNPHFLFNCLNSLSVLISEAPSVAEKFVDEMSKVYRYLLQVNATENEGDLVTLESEVRFISSYVYLLETRFESGICVKIDVNDLYCGGQLVPLTLQTLVDNAIRHNVVSATHPLHIRIQTTPNGLLEVQNNCQKRAIRAPYHSEGLSNLIQRYQLLFHKACTVQIKEDAHSFSVILPLIHS